MWIDITLFLYNHLKWHTQIYSKMKYATVSSLIKSGWVIWGGQKHLSWSRVILAFDLRFCWLSDVFRGSPSCYIDNFLSPLLLRRRVWALVYCAIAPVITKITHKLPPVQLSVGQKTVIRQIDGRAGFDSGSSRHHNTKHATPVEITRKENIKIRHSYRLHRRTRSLQYFEIPTNGNISL